MGCSCILLTWACRNRQGSITSRVAKFGKRIKETAIPCLADSMASILPFQVHGHSPDAGRQRPLRQAGRQAQGRGLFPSGALSFQRVGQQTGQRAGRAPFPGQRPCCPFAGQGSLPRSLLPCLAVMRRATYAACPAAPAASPSLPVSPRQQHRPIYLMRTLRTQQAHPPPRHTQNNEGPYRQVTGNTPRCKKIFHAIS